MKMFKVMLYLLCGLLVVNTSVAGEKSKSKRKNPVAFAKAEKALQSNDFVFYFDMFKLDSKLYANVDEGANYIYVDGGKGMIVITTNQDRLYAQDVLVVDGKVSETTCKNNKKGNIIYSAVLTGTKGVVRVNIIVARDNNYATLRLNSNLLKGGLGGNRYLGNDQVSDVMIANGRVVAIDEASVEIKLPNTDMMKRPNSVKYGYPTSQPVW